MVSVGTDESSWRSTLEIAERHDDVVTALGIHPHAAADGDVGALREALAHPRRSPSARPVSTTSATTRPVTRSSASSSTARACVRAVQARRHPHESGGRGHARSAEGIRRHGSAALLLVAPATRAGPRARLVRLVRRQRLLQERARHPLRGVRRSRRSGPRGNGFPVPDAGAAARLAERARERRSHVAALGAREERREADLAAQIDANAARCFGL